MFDCHDVAAAVETRSADPRITEEAIRCVPSDGDGGTVLLVGVVHDHPASTSRVAGVLETVMPDFLALELPPLAVSLFQMYARDVETPPRLGGEMSMAIQAAGDVESVGIDGPNPTYLRTLVKTVADRGITPDAVPAVLKDVVTNTAHAVACRLGALVGTWTPLRLRLYSHIEYDCTLLDSPSEQATHESSHLSQQQTFLQAIEVPEPIRLVDQAREESMVAHLRRLRSKGDVVAVVGMEHLDAIEKGLSTSS